MQHVDQVFRKEQQFVHQRTVQSVQRTVCPGLSKLATIQMAVIGLKVLGGAAALIVVRAFKAATSLAAGGSILLIAVVWKSLQREDPAMAPSPAHG